jgi:hypothetical protein
MTTTIEPRYATGEDHFSSIDPEEYRVAGFFYQGDSEEMGEAYRYEHQDLFAELERTYGIFDWDTLFAAAQAKSRWHCMGCGTQYLHGAVVLHEPTSRLLTVGQVCASKHYGLENIVAKMQAAAAKIAERKACEAAGMKQLAETPELLTAFVVNGLAAQAEIDGTALRGQLRTSFQKDVLGDMLRKLIQWGNLSTKQIAFASKLGQEIIERAAKELEPKTEAEKVRVPVPESEAGALVEGTVISAKGEHHPRFGYTYKMLIETVGGYRLWGTIPKALDEATSGWDLAGYKGIQLRFVADIERSQKDAFFGFFKRPRKVEIIDLHEDEAAEA